MAETLFNQFADEGALQAQRDFFLNEVLKPIKEGIKGLNVNIGTIDSSQSKRNVDELSRATDALDKSIKASQDQMTQLNATLKEFVQQTGNAAKVQNDAARAATQQAKAQKDLASAALLQAKADNEAAKATKTKAQSNKEIEKAQKAEQKAVEDATNDYLQLAKAYNEAALKAKNYVLRLGENHPIAVQAVKDANDIGNTLKRLDASVGQNQRNVGNYASAVSGLGFSFTQVARELPSLAVNFQQFALAISNNLPYVADNLVRTRQEIAALRAEGKQAPSLFSAITKSIFTWQVGLAVAITLFTVFAKQIGEFVSNLFKSNQAIDQAKESQKVFNEVLEQTGGAAKTAAELVGELTIDIGLAKDGFLKKDDVVRHYNETIGKTTGEVQNLDEAEKALTRNGQAYIDMMLLKAAANLALDKAAQKAFEAEEKRRKSAEEFKNSLADTKVVSFGSTTFNAKEFEADQARVKAAQEKRKADAVKQAEDEKNNFKNIAEDFQKQAAEIAKKFGFNFFDFKDTNGSEDKLVKEINKLLTAKIENARDANLQIANDEDKFIAERLKARQKAFDLDNQLTRLRANFDINEARRNADEQIKEQKGNADNIKIIQSNLAKEIAYIRDRAIREDFLVKSKRDEDELKLQDEFYQRLINNVAKNEKALSDAKTGLIKNKNEDAKKEFDEEMVLIEAFYDQQQKIIFSNLKKNKITNKEFNQQRITDEKSINANLLDFELEKSRNDKAFKKAKIDAEIQYTQKLKDIALLQGNGEEVAKQDKKLFELKKQLRDEDLKDYEEYRIKIAEANKKINEDIKNSLQKLTDQIKETLFAALAGSYDKQINKIHDQIDAVNELKAAEIERVNSSTSTAEEKAARIKIIEARAQNAREALDRRQRLIERNKAIVEKAASSFSITIGGIRDVARIKSEMAVAIAAAQKYPPPFNAIATARLIAQEGTLIGLSIATTAASLAGVLATPIPHFYKGTDYSPEGIAEVAERGPELVVDQKGNAKVYEKHTLTYLTKGTKIYPADATKDILNAAEQDRSTLLKQFNNNVTISTPDHSEKLDKMNKTLERIEGKSKIMIVNTTPIETQAWYQQHFKF